jgi:hypothetical protein
MRSLEVSEKAGSRYLSALAYQGAAELLDAALNPPSYDDEDDTSAICAVCGDVIQLLDSKWNHRPGCRSPHDATPTNA